MFNTSFFARIVFGSFAFVWAVACFKPTQTFKQIAAGKDFAGFLTDYSNLKPNLKLDGEALTFAQPDAQKNLRRYVAIIVDPVATYVASDAAQARIDENARASVIEYFRAALVQEVSSAFPVV